MAIAPPSPEHARLIHKLSSISALDTGDVAALATLSLRTRSLEAGVEIIAHGATSIECCFIIEGWLCRYALTKAGGRQIVSFHIPGDIPDRDGLHTDRMDYGIGAISAARVAFIAHADLWPLIHSRPNIALALWRDGILDAAVSREWLTGLGRRTAKQRLAHLICEMFARMETLGLADQDHFSFPVTQSQLGDALGLSTVHVNRMLQDLRAANLISWKSTVLTVQDAQALRSLADFDPSYLQLKSLD
jgi:CRP-like cAMP-binding protein